METKKEQLNSKQLLDLRMFVIETRDRRKDKDSYTDWRVEAAFMNEDSLYNFYGKFHQNRFARILKPKSS